MPEGTGGGPERPQVSNEGTAAAIAQRSEISSMPQQLRSVGEIITDAQRHAVLSGNIPKIPEAPDLGGERSDKDLDEVITGEIIEHKPDVPVEEKSAKAHITGLGRWRRRGNDEGPEVPDGEPTTVEVPQEAQINTGTQDADSPNNPTVSTPKTGNAEPSNKEPLATAPTTEGGGPAGGKGGKDGDDGDHDGGRDREPPNNGPERMGTPELIERGGWFAEQILEMRTMIPIYDERYNEENAPQIRGLYDSLQKCVNEICRIRGGGDLFGPHLAYPRPTRDESSREILNLPTFADLPEELKAIREKVVQFKAQYELEGIEDPDLAESFTIEPLPTVPVLNRLDQYFNLDPASQDFKDAEADLKVYFRQSKNQGLLSEVDMVLNSIYREISRPGLPHSQAASFVDSEIARAVRITAEEFRDRRGENPTLPLELADVGVAYIEWARRRMERNLNGQPQPDHREGEWRAGVTQEPGVRETYWEVGHYPKLYIINAKTPEQFLTAKETFLQMVRSGALGKSPTANFEHVKNFIEEFSRAGGVQYERNEITSAFLNENRKELEGLLYLRVAAYSKEVYNPKQSKEASEAMALDEGPDRWVAAYRSGKGGTAAFTHMFDYEMEMDIFNNAVGEQGELNIIAGHFLQDVIQRRAIERGMGIVLKDYDPRDSYLNSDDLGAKIRAAADIERIKRDLKVIENGVRDHRIKLKPGETATSRLSERDQARLNAFTANLNRLGLTRSQEEFKELYEGFDKGDTHIKNYKSYAEDQRKPEDQRKYPSLKQLPESIRSSIDLGRIQVQLGAFRQAIVEGTIKLEPGQKAMDLLSPRDRQIYQAAFDEAEANFEVAFDMQNVLGEKARRGKGFLFSDRNQHIQEYFKISDELRSHWIDEARTKVLNTDGFTENEIKDYSKKLPDASRESFMKGWMLYKIRDGKKLNTFSQEWKDLYTGMSPKEKEDVVDNIPTYEAENWVSWGVSWTKMKYSDNSNVWTPELFNDVIAKRIRSENIHDDLPEFENFKARYRRAKVAETRKRLIKEIRTNGYSAQLIAEDRQPGREPVLMKYKKPLGRIDPETGQFRKFKNGEVLGYDDKGKEVKLSFDQEGKVIGLNFDGDGKVVVYDKADPAVRQRINYDSINKNTIARLAEYTFTEDGVQKNDQTLVEEAIPTFDFAARSSDFRNRYTIDTYVFYQGNNRQTKLTPEVLEARERIAKGLSRPEDEDPLAEQALILDLTRSRTKKFDEVLQAREVNLMGAAVLESFQDRMRTRHSLFRAFLPKDAYRARMRAGYRNEDWAGMDRFTFGFYEMAAQQTSRLSRRLGAALAIMPFEHDSGPARWGEHGVSGGIKLMADEIKNIAKQGDISQFGLTKIYAIFDKAIELYNHIASYTDPQRGENVFGLAEKPTDNNETMHQYTKQAEQNQILENPTDTIPFLYKFKESFARLQTVMHDMRVMYSNNDNSSGILNLEEVDIFLEDGSFNTVIEATGKNPLLSDSGTARWRQRAFLDGEDGEPGFYKWLVDESPGGGGEIYDGELYWNEFLFREYKETVGVQVGDKINRVQRVAGKIKDWLTDKII